MDIIQAFRIILSRLPLILGIPFIAAMTTGVLTMMAPKKFTSEARLSTGYTVTNRISLNEERFTQFNADMKFNNLIEVIKSPIIIGVLSYSLALHDLKSDKPFTETEEGNENWIEEDFDLTKEDVINTLEQKIEKFELLSSYDDTEKNILGAVWSLGYSPLTIRESLGVRRINYTDYITIQYESENPLLAAHVVNAMCDEFLRYNSIVRYRRSSESIELLDTLATQKKQVLNAKSDQLRTYKSRNNFLNFQLESESKISQVKDAESRKEETLNEIRGINLSMASMDARITEYSSDEVNKLRSRLADLIEQRRVAGFSDYRVLTDSIITIRGQVDDVINTSKTLDTDLKEQRYELNIQLQIEEEKLEAIQQRLSFLRREVSAFASSEASIASMDRELNIASQEYLEVQQKLNDAINANIDSKESIRVLVQGQPALEPQSSGTILKSGFAFVGVIVICIISILLMEFMDPKIKTTNRFLQLVDIPLLETIYSPSVYVNHEQQSVTPKFLTTPVILPFGQAIRKIRYDITNQNGKVILFASLKQGEGKSFVMYEIAKSLHAIGKRVLIIDTNFRNHEFFKMKLENDQEKLEIDVFNLLPPTRIGDGETLEQALIFEDYFLTSKTNENVHIMPNRNPGGSPAEVLSRSDFSKMISTLIETGVYDYFFLESAAMNKFTDVLELTKYCDKVVMVFNGESEFNDQDRHTLKLIDKFEDKVLGAILNQASVPV